MRFFAIAAVFAATAAFGADFTLYNVVPFSPGNEKVAAADAKEYLGRTGNDLVLYSLTLHPEGRPAIDKVRRYVESFRRFKAELAGSDVRAGILVSTRISKTGRGLSMRRGRRFGSVRLILPLLST